jgi:hypothetical protein
MTCACGSRHAIDLDGLVAAYPFELALLQHPQQLGLECRRYFTDFVWDQLDKTDDPVVKDLMRKTHAACFQYFERKGIDPFTQRYQVSFSRAFGWTKLIRRRGQTSVAGFTSNFPIGWEMPSNEWLKDRRRIATRYDKLARNFASAVAPVAAIVWWID